jgi:multidrug efflux system outer membrane protein
MMVKNSFVSILVTAMLFASCTVGPDYTEPRIELPENYVNGKSQALAEASRTMWWRAFADPVLNEIVDLGLRQNLDVRAAVQRIETARALASRTGIPAQLDGGVALDSRRIERQDGSRTSLSGVTADAFFVFDLFGEFRRGREGALANLEAVQFDAGTVRLAYLAEVIDAYNQARFFRSAAEITRQSIASRQQTLDFIEQRASAGEATALELAQARSLLATAQAGAPILQGRYQENVFRIAALIAQPASVVLTRMKPGRAQLRPRGATPTGVPADILRNRPDVRSAERSFAAATAAIGIAEAQLLPSLTIDGTITSGDLTGWGFGPSLFLPILNRPVLEANRKAAVSTAKEAELFWRNSVLKAVEETQSSLVLVRQWARQTYAFQRAADAAIDVQKLSRQSYEIGGTTLLDVIDAERFSFVNRLAVASSVREWTASYVQLQVSAGKGWLVGVERVYVVKRSTN